MKRLFPLGLLALVFGCCSDSGGTVGTMPAAAQEIEICDPGITVELSECYNAPKSEIQLSGSVSWPGLVGKFVVSNAFEGPHQAEVPVFELVLVEAGEAVFDKEPVKGGVGGNPHIWFQLEDGDGNPIGDPVYLGRCVQDGGKKD